MGYLDVELIDHSPRPSRFFQINTTFNRDTVFQQFSAIILKLSWSKNSSLVSFFPILRFSCLIDVTLACSNGFVIISDHLIKVIDQ